MTSGEHSVLESKLSEVALALFAPGTLEGTLHQVVTLAVAAIDGCDAAGIFLVEDERVTTVALTDPVVTQLDQLQFDTDEGPCLDAVSEEGTVYVDDLVTSARWPSFAPIAVEAGIRSALAFRLSAQRASALNLYARLPAAFGATDRARDSSSPPWPASPSMPPSIGPTRRSAPRTSTRR